MSDLNPTRRIQACAYEPVSVDDMQMHSRIDQDTDYPYVAGLIIAAREYVEGEQWRLLGGVGPEAPHLVVGCVDGRTSAWFE